MDRPQHNPAPPGSAASSGGGVTLRIPNGILTQRIHIRPHTLDDLGPFTEFMVDEDATYFLTFDAAQKTPEGARSLLEYIVGSYETEAPVFALAAVERSTRAYLGSCGLSPLAGEDGVECFFWLLRRYWGWGFATETTRALLYYAFEELNVPAVVVNAARANKRAWKVLETVGFVNDGPVKLPNMPRAQRFLMSRESYDLQDE